MQKKSIFEHLLIIAVFFLYLGCQHNGRILLCKVPSCFCDTDVIETCPNDVNVTHQCLYSSKDLESSVATLNGKCPEGLNKFFNFIMQYLKVCCCCCCPLSKDIP